jgi:hypothetical protein
MPRHARGEPLVANVSFRLPVTDHQRLLAYADAHGLAWNEALRQIIHQSLWREEAEARPGGRLRKPTPA